MKTIRKNAYDVNTWQQVSNKIRSAADDKHQEHQSFMERLKSSSSGSNPSPNNRSK